LRVEEYLMPSADKRQLAAKRILPAKTTWQFILKRADNGCEWREDGQNCLLQENSIDPVGGGRVKLTPDHKQPHSIDPNADLRDPEQWQALCGRHQIIKKNYWNTMTGKLNVYAIIQSSTREEKLIAFKFLLDYFGYILQEDGQIERSTN